MDAFTKKYYNENYDIEEFTPIPVEKPLELVRPPIVPPPHTGYGSEEDSMMSVYKIDISPPKKDHVKLMKHAQDVLRFRANLISKDPADRDRVFIVCFYLMDDTMSIFEQPVRNSGFFGGKFLQRSRVRRSSSTGDASFLSAADMKAGNVIVVNEHHFQLLEPDLRTTNFFDGAEQPTSPERVQRILTKVREVVLNKNSRMTDAFRYCDEDHKGAIGLEGFRQVFRRNQIPVTEEEILILLRHFDKDGDGVISFHEFVSNMMPEDGAGNAAAAQPPLTNLTLADRSVFRAAQARRARENFTQQVFKRFREKLFSRRLVLADTFRLVSDRSPDSLVGPKEFRKALSTLLQLNLSDSEMEALLDWFFPQGEDQRITLKEFQRAFEGKT